MHLQFLLTEVFYHELKMCYSLVECAALKASLAAAKSKADAAASSSSTPAKPAPVVLALMTPVDIMTGWDSKLLDGGFLWGGGLNYLRANGGYGYCTHTHTHTHTPNHNSSHAAAPTTGAPHTCTHALSHMRRQVLDPKRVHSLASLPRSPQQA